MAITALPPSPQRNDPDFADTADTWIAALPTWTTQVNALGVDLTNKQIAAAASEVAAELAETNAETAQGLSEAARDLSIANASGTVAAGSSKDWASKVENSEVISGAYSALHWAAKAAASVAVLPSGTINDGLIAADKTWSSEKLNIDIELSKKITPLNKTANYTIISTNRANSISGTGSITFNIDSAATLGNGWFCYVQNIGGNNIIIEPYNSETIDLQSNVLLEPDNLFLIISDGTNLKCIRLNKSQPHYITASETWICPAGVYEIDVELWAAGGSGSRDTSNAYSGGNGGAYSRKKIITTPGTSKVITIGTGGASKTTNGDGVSGGASAFSTDITCGGGVGGSASLGAVNAISSSSGGDINISGGIGSSDSLSSFGGSSFGTPAAAQYKDSITVRNGNFPGGGSAGTKNMNSGAGANGLCIIWY